MAFNYLRIFACVCGNNETGIRGPQSLQCLPYDAATPKTKTVPHAKSVGTVRRELLGVPDVMLKGHSYGSKAFTSAFTSLSSSRQGIRS